MRREGRVAALNAVKHCEKCGAWKLRGNVGGKVFFDAG